MEKYLLVAVGGAVGSVGRYAVGVATSRLGAAWPYGTFTVNLLGGCLMGLLVGYLALRGGDGQERLRMLLAVGVLGGFTTFSAYSLELALMLEKKAFVQAVAYGVLSTILAVTAVFGGLMFARRVFA